MSGGVGASRAEGSAGPALPGGARPLEATAAAAAPVALAAAPGPGSESARAAEDQRWRRTLDVAIDRYHDVLTAYVDRGGEDHLGLLARMTERGAVFAGRPICTMLRPQILLRSQHELIKRAVIHFRSAVTKAKQAILASPELLEQMGLSDGERRLLDVNPEFKSFGVVTRLDTILNGGDLSFVELNAEGALGGAYADELTDLFEGFQPLREWSRAYHVTPMYAGNALVGSILDTWHEFGGTRVPRVAVVDFADVVTRAEFDLVCERFRRHGIPARFVDPRELEYKDGELKANGQGIDVIYRRLLTQQILAREGEVRALLDACRARVVCVVNSFRAKLLDKKMLFALLFDPRVEALLDAEERAALRRHVPWTRRVAEGKTTGFAGEMVDLLPWAVSHRADLVLKPNDGRGGRGVVLGASASASAWEGALAGALEAPYVLQRRVSLPSAMFPEVTKTSELTFSRRYIELDPYLFRGDTRGVLTRLSATPLCDDSATAGTVPTFILEDEGGHT